MTLDGHIKTGLAASIFCFVALPMYFPGIEQSALIFIIAAFAFGNVGPDLTELGIIPHRTHTHYPWYYVAIIAGTLASMNFELLEGALWALPLVAYCSGCLLHIICDIPYGGIPYILPNRKITIMRVPFDGYLNRLIEHSVVLGFVFAFIVLGADIDLSTNFNISDFTQSTDTESGFQTK